MRPQDKTGDEDHVIEEDLPHQPDDFAEREDDVEALVAFAEALDPAHSAPAQKRVHLDGHEVGHEEHAVQDLPVCELKREPGFVAHGCGFGWLLGLERYHAAVDAVKCAYEKKTRCST
jgi:hypothetical protein